MKEFCKKLKALRIENNLTQTDVAKALNITTQAVSKWESQSSLPDITLLVPLADYYGVTVDYLLGHDITEKEKEISDYLEECESNVAFRAPDEWGSVVERTRGILKKYPSDHRLLLELCGELFMIYKRCGADSKTLLELIDIGDVIISQSTDNSLRYKATNWMIYAYYELGLYQNVKKLVDGLPDLSQSKDVLEYFCAPAGTRKVLIAEQSLVYKCFDTLCGSMLKYGTDVDDKMITPDGKMSVCRTVASMIQAYFPAKDYDGNMLEYLYRAELYSALYAAIKGDIQMTIDFLERALASFERIDGISASVLQNGYTSPFLKELSAPVGAHKNRYKKLFLKVTGHMSFDAIRNEEAFKGIEGKILTE